jgi:uronate dehydrogenase
MLRDGPRGMYSLLRLAERRALGDAAAGEELATFDLMDMPALCAMRGVECIVHLGGTPRESDRHVIHENNIAGTYNMFEAAPVAQVKRVIFASSNHAIGYYRAERKLGTNMADATPIASTRSGYRHSPR